MGRMTMPRPLMSAVISNEPLNVDSPGITEWFFDLPRGGILMGLRVECKRGRKIVKRARLLINETSYVFDLPWPRDSKREWYIPCGMASAPDVVGLGLHVVSAARFFLSFAPGTYTADFRVIMEWVPIPMPGD